MLQFGTNIYPKIVLFFNYLWQQKDIDEMNEKNGSVWEFRAYTVV